MKSKNPDYNSDDTEKLDALEEDLEMESEVNNWTTEQEAEEYMKIAARRKAYEGSKKKIPIEAS